MDKQTIDNFTTYLNFLLSKHQEEQALESYYAVCEQIDKITNAAEALVVEYLE